MEHRCDILVIGGGHAGCEAALIAAKMGCNVALLTMRADRVAEMSCNPSVGGVGKGQLVRELDALGGEMGKNADFTGIQFKRLNMRKGSAVQSSRCQSDKIEYARRMSLVVKQKNGITLLEGEAKALLMGGGRVIGVSCVSNTHRSFEVMSKSVILTAGTFLRAVMHCGFDESEGGRFGEASSNGFSTSLSEAGLIILRLKTGTPARLVKATIDFDALQEQRGDDPPRRFSFSQTEILLPQVSCFLGYSSSKTHDVIRRNLARSPLYSGKITGIGPRYCPSIEDKIVKFPDKASHHVFFEPESLSSDLIYPNGISTSMPADVQEEFIRTLPGCANVSIARYGYAVEYDCIDPTQLDHHLECRSLKGLFFAGQINGTSGYEEAAAQGLLAGINAALQCHGRPGFVLDRSEAYIGVMIDDLVTKGVTEPYRMFTSRSEYRLSIREDNAELRLRPHAIDLGTITLEEQRQFEERIFELDRCRAFISGSWLKPTMASKAAAAKHGVVVPSEAQTIKSILRRPEYSLGSISEIWGLELAITPHLSETLEIETKYEGYINMQKTEIERLRKMRALRLPVAINYAEIKGLSREVMEKLSRIRPGSIGDAAQIAGVTPSALTAILVHINKPNQLRSHVGV